MTTFQEPIQPIANINDIVTLGKYGERRFKVISMTHEFHIDAEIEIEEIYYDIMCLKSYETIVADQDSITVIKRTNNIPTYSSTRTRRPMKTAHVPTIDELLDDLRSALKLREIFGDHKNDDKRDYKYASMVRGIKSKLRDQLEVV